MLRELDKTVDMSRANTGMWLNLAINYGGRAELVDAVQAIGQPRAGRRACRRRRRRSDDCRATSTRPGSTTPTCLIRTAGELRISNFLLWQISYAEIWVTDRCWPEFDEATLHDAIRDYAGRQRRFGGLPGELHLL